VRNLNKNDFLNQKAGGVGLGILLITTYISIKYSLINEISILFSWQCVWFGLLIIQALVADLFNLKEDSWIYKSLKEIEGQENLPPDEKISLIRFHLEMAVERYMVVFLAVNGLKKWKYITKNLLRIQKGVITIKELIILVLYALYDLVIRSGLLSFTFPIDIIIIFIGLTILKIIDASQGILPILVQMYKVAFSEKGNTEILKVTSNLIKQLSHIYDMETLKTPENHVKKAVEILNENIPKLEVPQDQ